MAQLPLPLTMSQLLRDIVDEALSNKLPPVMNTPQARVQLCATAGQETGLRARRQYGNGPARGLWEFEKGGVRDIFDHHSASLYLEALCKDAGIPYTVDDVYNNLEHDDIFACRVARLLYWTDAHPLPAIGQEEEAWKYYIRNWGPGKPDRNRWKKWYPLAAKTVLTPIVSERDEFGDSADS